MRYAGEVTIVFLAADGEPAPERPSFEARRQLQNVLAANWRDGEIRTETIPSAGETAISLGLLLAGEHGIVTMVLSARVQQKVPRDPPAEFQVLMGAGLNVPPNLIRRRVLRFVLDAGGPNATTIDASDRIRVLDPDPAASIDEASATITLVELVQLLRSDVITAQILGFDVSLTTQQRNAVRDFGMRVLRPAPHD
jgi:hypothetical protein